MNHALDVDPAVHAELGDRTLTDLRSVLHPVDCQACGRGFDDADEPTVAVDVLDDTAFAGLYHKHCRQSEWHRHTGAVVGSRQLSWRAAAFVSSDTATLLVNPSCEGAFLRQRGTRWRLSTLDVYARTGFQRFTAGSSPVPDLEIQLDTDEVTACRVKVPTLSGPRIDGLPPDFIWRARIPPAFYAKVRADNQLTLCVSDAFDPDEDVTVEQVERLMADGRAVCTVAPVTLFSPSAQVVDSADLDDVRTAAAYLDRRGPVHLMVPNLTAAEEYERVLDPPSCRADSRVRTTARTVVLGTYEQFAAAWECPNSTVAGATGQGCLALAVAPAPDLTSQRFMRRYARRIELRDGQEALSNPNRIAVTLPKSPSTSRSSASDRARR